LHTQDQGKEKSMSHFRREFNSLFCVVFFVFLRSFIFEGKKVERMVVE